MSNNPYSTPDFASDEVDAQRQLRAPAIALLLCSLFGVGFAVIGGVYWVPHLYHPDSTVAEHQLALQTIVFSCINSLVSVVVFVGAISMLRQNPRWLALTGAWAAVVPLFGPCVLLTIPFGIWALVVLHKREVAASFGRSAQ